MDLPAKKRKQPAKITQKLLDKLEKKSILEKQKHLKPGECMKVYKTPKHCYCNCFFIHF